MIDICLFNLENNNVCHFCTDNHEYFIQHVKEKHSHDRFAQDYLKRQQDGVLAQSAPKESG